MSDEGQVIAILQTNFDTGEATLRKPTPSELAAPTGSSFRVKLLQLWIFDRMAGKDWQGIWETQSLHDQGTEKEQWTLRRAFITGPEQSFDDRRNNIPTWLLLESAKCVKLETVYTPNAKLRDAGESGVEQH